MNNNENNLHNNAFHDFGPNPLVFNIDKATKINPHYRFAVWTGNNMQVTLMNIDVDGEIGLEMHPDVDQFIRIEDGYAIAIMGNSKDSMTYRANIDEDFAIIIPAGTWHNIINIGDTPLKLYSIYTPPNHPFGTVQETQETAEKEHH